MNPLFSNKSTNDLKNYRDDFITYVFRRISQYRDYGVSPEEMTPTKYTAYQHIRAVLVIKLDHLGILKQGNNKIMSREVYEILTKAVDEILPDKNRH